MTGQIAREAEAAAGEQDDAYVAEKIYIIIEKEHCHGHQHQRFNAARPRRPDGYPGPVHSHDRDERDRSCAGGSLLRHDRPVHANHRQHRLQRRVLAGPPAHFSGSCREAPCEEDAHESEPELKPQSRPDRKEVQRHG
ncbi:hypothetical protein ACFU99_14210, partial [Streptomyces sp. NPDC057654]|uniref:hypothetical protein n=1 Tax=Streptomyces sp. NPDC057654 TaxID=3346196 RepID=UPI0036C3C089